MKNRLKTIFIAISASLTTMSLFPIIQPSALSVTTKTVGKSIESIVATATPMIGEITLFAGNFVPRDFLLCDGQSVSISSNSVLYTIMGNTYGSIGNSFKLPDLRGRIPVHPGQASSGGSNVQRGNFGGNETLSNINTTQVAAPGRTGNTTDIISAMETNTRNPSIGINYILSRLGTFPSSNNSFNHDGFIGEIFLFSGNFAPNGFEFCAGQELNISTNTALFSILQYTYGGVQNSTFKLPDLRGRVPVQPGTGPGLATIALGEMGGSEQIPISVNAATAVGRSSNVSVVQSPTSGTQISSRDPYLGVNYIIKVTGVFPSMN